MLAGKYRVVRILGKGGMGVVVEAENTLIERRVAIKLLHTDLSDNEVAVERFHREAETAAATGHDHIVDILDLGRTEQGNPFIVMELLRGKTLQELLREERLLETDRAVRIAIQALSALSAVHAKGIVHRDLKPANILLVEKAGRSDFVKLVDFGVSKIRSSRMERNDLTATGMVMGTPHYMAPEQARGAKSVDHRADLYAMGAILYRCLSGRVPYRGANYNQILAKILAQDPRPLGELRPDLPKALVAVVEKSMSRDPDLRYQSAKTFGEDLAMVVDVDLTLSFAEVPAAHSLGVGQTAALSSPEMVAQDASEDAATVAAVPDAIAETRGASSVHRTGRSGSMTGPGVHRSSRQGLSVSVPATRPVARRPWSLVGGILGAILLLAVVGAGGYWLFGSREGRPTLRFGLAEYMPKEAGGSVISDLAKFLAEQTGARVATLYGRDPMSVLEDLHEGRIDLAFVSPLLFVRARQRHLDLIPLCSIRSGQRGVYQGLIVGRVDRHINKLSDLKGKTFCWVSRNSTSGYLLPYLTFLDAGYDPDKLFGKQVWAGSHEKALEYLQNGLCDAVAVFDALFYDKLGRIRKFGVIAPTGPIPQDILVASPHMDQVTRFWIQDVFLSADRRLLAKHPLAGEFQITAFVPFRAASYEMIRRALVRVEGNGRTVAVPAASGDSDGSRQAPQRR